MVSRGRGKGFGVYGLSNNCYGLGDSTMKEVGIGFSGHVSGTMASQVWGKVGSEGYGIGFVEQQFGVSTFMGETSMMGFDGEVWGRVGAEDGESFVGRFGEELEQMTGRILWGGLQKCWSRGGGGFSGEVCGRGGAVEETVFEKPK
ncbi:hypothetical protein DEO72_LG2g2706 [Vigna unguiculata]|uniref:Uncharacterized protein n=1 Tax=Vigna unguiculata TaxID=3917 RepID=A0A4D6L1K9_VIGUN|nr:hypothetical protein DEO72_LG2g2706 [Vigna unguiculata]